MSSNNFWRRSFSTFQIFYEKVCAKTEFKDAPTRRESFLSRVRFLLCCCCQEPKLDADAVPDDADVEMRQFPGGKTLEPSDETNGAVEYAKTVVAPPKPPRRTHWGDVNLVKLPPAIDMAIWLYRFRVTIALIVGNARYIYRNPTATLP